MAEAKLNVLVTAKDEASRELDKVGKSTEGLSKKMKMLGAAMAVGAGVGIAVMTSFVKAAAKEEAGIIRLDVAMRNMGISYEDNKDSLEGWIDMMQQKTSIADDEQRDSLASLVRMTGDLEKAQNLLTLSMDVAVGTGKDLASATTLMMYAMGGNWGMLERYIPALKVIKDEEGKWMKLREMFAGQAEEFGKSTAGQFKTLQNNIGDLKEAMGTALLPVVQELLDPIKEFVMWMKEHPELTKFAAAAMAVSTGLLAIGAASIFASKIVSTTLIPMFTKLVVFIWSTVIPALSAKLGLLLAIMAASPVGWVMLAGTLAAIAAIAIATPKLVGQLSGGGRGGRTPFPGEIVPPSPPPAPPSPYWGFQYGGVVPGRHGQPVPIIAHGGERFLGAGTRAGINLTFNYQPMIGIGSESEMRDAADRLREYLREGDRRTIERIV